MRVDRDSRKRATIVDIEPSGPKDLFYAEIRVLRKRQFLPEGIPEFGVQLFYSQHGQL